MSTRIGMDPNATTQTSTSGMSTSEIATQMCHMQSDIRKLTQQSKDVIDINRAMLEEQQRMSVLTQTLVEKTTSLVEKTSSMVEKTSNLVDKIDDLVVSSRESMDKIEGATDQMIEVVEKNDTNTFKLLEALYESMDDNKINMEFMNGNIETIAQASLTLAYVNGETDAEVAAAMDRASAELLKNKDENDELRSYIRQVLEEKYAASRAERLKS